MKDIVFLVIIWLLLIFVMILISGGIPWGVIIGVPLFGIISYFIYRKKERLSIPCDKTKKE
jgi:uncharacterized membrane protein